MGVRRQDFGDPVVSWPALYRIDPGLSIGLPRRRSAGGFLSRAEAATLYTIGALLDVSVTLLLPAARANPDPRVARIPAIVAEPNRIEDCRFLAALLTRIAAARDYRAYVPTR